MTSYLSTEAEIQAAIDNDEHVIPLAPCDITITTGLTLKSGTRLLGAGRGITKLMCDGAGHGITNPVGTSFTEIKDLDMVRVGTPTSANNGVHGAGLNQRALIERVNVSGFWTGVRLPTTSFSKVVEVLADNNYGHGIHITNADQAGGMQWTLIDCLAQRSNGCGLLVEAVTSSASVGEILNFSTWANKVGGAHFKGQSGKALHGVRWRNGFVGEDGGDAIMLDTYAAAKHSFSNVYVEISGTAACGVNQSTPATNQGRGFYLTANNPLTSISDCVIVGNSWSGIDSLCDLSATGNQIALNGAANLSGERNGIYQHTGTLHAVGNRITGHTNFGIYTTNDNYHNVSGNWLRGNGAGQSFGMAVTRVNSIEANNIK